MAKDILALIGIDGVAGMIIYFIEPSYVKWVISVGIFSLLGLLLLTRQGRVSIYGSQLVMALMVAARFT